MYGQGSATPTPAVVAAVPAVAGVTTAALLPQTGASSLIGIALAVAAALVVWATIYVARAKFSAR
jgi:hypothetical protein